MTRDLIKKTVMTIPYNISLTGIGETIYGIICFELLKEIKNLLELIVNFLKQIIIYSLVLRNLEY